MTNKSDKLSIFWRNVYFRNIFSYFKKIVKNPTTRNLGFLIGVPTENAITRLS